MISCKDSSFPFSFYSFTYIYVFTDSWKFIREQVICISWIQNKEEKEQNWDDTIPSSRDRNQRMSIEGPKPNRIQGKPTLVESTQPSLSWKFHDQDHTFSNQNPRSHTFNQPPLYTFFSKLETRK